MRVLGVDPGTRATGYGVIETGNGAPGMGRLIECGGITFARHSPLPRRLHQLHVQIADLIARHRPTTLVLGHARGVILLAAEEAGLAIAQYPPATVKKTAVGAGGAPKAQVGAVVARLLKLRQAPAPADAADGVAVALTHILRA